MPTVAVQQVFDWQATVITSLRSPTTITSKQNRHNRATVDEHHDGSDQCRQ
ncbi:Uncharacterised protein [Vibrio cholerae]|uniref:Uncharacterized protein n=1 Tax=Vibrio cholerae TaxID=666 RepID=A0A655X116_VIBCL|nr:Uncharacterised protein [Vibrio cholerae]CSA41820.1 Uncharacterised protein [Vibrio cholerae]CSB51769.1 Uncharacterised protein [Vibrio cholerae]CSB64251.1 Uncharacterised protein [Vibrio cholerae]CSB78782.1 Uncharacterised protein [Vibrio cholerae]